MYIVLVWEYLVKVAFLVESAGTALRNLKHEITGLPQIRVYYDQRNSYVTASDSQLTDKNNFTNCFKLFFWKSSRQFSLHF